LSNLMTAGSDNYFNGVDAYEASKVGTLQAGLVAAFPSHATMISNAVSDFQQWYETVYAAPAATENSWIPEQLEYNFSCALPENNGGNIVLDAKEYYSGDLEWYSFDVAKDAALTGLFSAPTAAEKALIKDELFSMIPVEAR